MSTQPNSALSPLLAPAAAAGDFETLASFLPAGWREQAAELGALRRLRGFDSPDALLRALLIHAAEGLSLRETAAAARASGLASVSDVALFKKLRQSGAWFRWMNERLAARWFERPADLGFARGWKIRAVDATRIAEPGKQGRSWVLCWSLDLETLACDDCSLYESGGKGESLARFQSAPGQLLIGDRAYGTRTGIAGAKAAGADAIVRFALSNLPLNGPGGRPFDALKAMRGLAPGEVGEWPASIAWKGEAIDGRVCAIMKSPAATSRALGKLRRRSSRTGAKTRAATIESARYFFVFTTVADRAKLSAEQVLELYRARWQVELAFKRLKSLVGLGRLRKPTADSARAWIEGKLLAALLVEAMARCARDFSPWGRP